MAKGNFAPSLADVLVHEGGYTNNRRDPGNWTGGKVGVGVLKGTNKGIAAATFPDLDIKNLNDNQVAEIYRARYWDKVRGDDLPSGVDLSTMDYGVNSGVSTPAGRAYWIITEPILIPIGSTFDRIFSTLDIYWDKTKPAFTIKLSRLIIRKIADPRPAWGY